MKSALTKGFVIVILSLLSVTAFANWKCRIHNAKGQVWNGIGPTRKAAAKTAMGFCIGSGTTMYAANCVIDVCVPGNWVVKPPPVKEWRCTIANNRGQAWYATGMTRKTAAMNAMGLCAGKSSSAYARSCHITACYIVRR